MGAHNVSQVFTHWTSRLTAREALALSYMALVSLDSDSPAVYFGGWEALALAIGCDPASNPTSAAEQVRRVTSKLASAGAVVSSGRARAGVRAEYALALDPLRTWRPIPGTGRGTAWEPVTRDSPTEKVGLGEKKPHRKGAPAIHRKGAPQPPSNGGASPTEKGPPMSTEEPPLGRLLGITGGGALNSPVPVVANRRREEPQLTEEQERNRQLAALRERMAREEAS